MFNNVTKTCSGTDATWEILTMLAGAFLLGCLLCWLIRKFRGLNTPPPRGNSSDEYDQNSTVASLHSTKDSTTTTSNKVSHQSYKATKVGSTYQTSAYTIPKIDDLKRISSIDENIESLLKDKGVKSYTDLRDVDHKVLFAVMDTPDFNVPKQEVETWPHQSSLAAKGEWKKLTEYQNFREKSQDALKAFSSKSSDTKPSTSSQLQVDDLTKISGITHEIAKILNKKGIVNFTQLRSSNYDELKDHLDNGNIEFEKLDTESWLQQAELAENEEWDDLDEYQDFLSIKSDNITTPSTLTEKEPSAEKEPLAKKESSAEEESITKIPPVNTDNEENDNDANLNLKNKISSVSKINQTDNLKKIEGIGPKIEEVLNNQGINTFKKLHESSRNTLKSHLDKAGSQFKMHEPESWPHQAGMAFRGEWQKLKEYQDFMMGGRDNTVSLSNSSKLTDNLSADKSNLETSANDTDDLTQIEGIGPKIQEVLNSHDIKTFNDLSKSSRNTLKLYLDEAGSQFKMHEPESWPHQAAMANDGEWDKLKEYQDFMVSGRDDNVSSSHSSSLSEDNKDSTEKKDSLSTSYVDDLTKIEGIGPKIEQLLNEAGILNFAQLKNTESNTIKLILDAGGPQFKMHVPESWPKQAEYADNADWERLEAYQDELFNGR